MREFTRTLAIVCVTLLAVACENQSVQELKALVDWDPEYTKDWAPAIGTSLPVLSVKNTEGETVAFEDLTGEKGLLIFFVRSTNW